MVRLFEFHKEVLKGTDFIDKEKYPKVSLIVLPSLAMKKGMYKCLLDYEKEKKVYILISKKFTCKSSPNNVYANH